MTVQQLIDLLQQQPPDAEVHFAYNSGDHWRTTIAPQVKHVDMLPVTHSDYHGKPIIADEDDDDVDYDTDNLVVVLTA